MRTDATFLVFAMLGFISAESLNAQAIDPVGKGKATAAVIGVAAAGAGIGIAAYLILHNRGVSTGCVTEAGGKRTFTTGANESYLLIESAPTLAPARRYKLKGRISGPRGARTFTVDKIMKNYGGCS